MLPSELIRRIFPATESSLCAKLGSPESPVVMYSLLSGPNFILPPSWYAAPGISSSRTLSSVSELFDSTYRTSLFLVENSSL